MIVGQDLDDLHRSCDLSHLSVRSVDVCNCNCCSHLCALVGSRKVEHDQQRKQTTCFTRHVPKLVFHTYRPSHKKKFVYILLVWEIPRWSFQGLVMGRRWWAGPSVFYTMGRGPARPNQFFLHLVGRGPARPVNFPGLSTA